MPSLRLRAKIDVWKVLLSACAAPEDRFAIAPLTSVSSPTRLTLAFLRSSVISVMRAPPTTPVTVLVAPRLITGEPALKE